MMGGDLDWSVATHGPVRVVSPRGRIDESTATAFADRLVAEIEGAQAGGSATLAIDLAGIDYMSSRGLRGLTLAQRRAGDNGIAIVLAQPNDVMREILGISRYDMVFKVYDSVEQVTSGQ